MAGSPSPMSTFESLNWKSASQLGTRQTSARPQLKRGSPLRMGAMLESRQYSMGDSSDDEIPAPMKFSALTKALLDNEASGIEVSSPPHEASGSDRPQSRTRNYSGGTSRDHEHEKSRPQAVSPTHSGSPVPRRTVRLSGGAGGFATVRRSASVSVPHQPSTAEGSPIALITPAPRTRSVRIKGSGASGASSGGSSVKPEADDGASPGLDQDLMAMPTTMNRTRYGISTFGRSRQGDETGVHGSVRIKRVGKVTGSFLSGPARRGGRRRQSEEEQISPVEDAQNEIHQGVSSLDDISPENQDVRFVSDENPPTKDELYDIPQHNDHQAFAEKSGQAKEDLLSLDKGSPPRPSSVADSSAKSINAASASSTTPAQPVFKVPVLPPSLPSAYDQENEPPPTFKRNKAPSFVLSDKLDHSPISKVSKVGGTLPATTMSPERKALAPRSRNTPHRPAPPPPPKMSVLETATATAGAATTSHSRKKRNTVIVNGKNFTRMDCIGRGGSSRVYRVMAENYKIFALKKVSLEDVDELAIRGYKGEIDLLKKLENVNRVVRLFDWEINDEKQTLSVLMEMGESDLNRILTMRLNAEDAKFDASFTRHYWKEMLECVKAVHQYDIVHSDLKPANFLLVQGRLKLIDFGIANAIQDDTVNVHREQQVGTPNYMSPEAIVDSNAKSGLSSAAGKMMKLGKPSDVWSLGCILYQMVYGKPPFAHITNQIQRIMAIPNPNHVIEYPSTGVGGAIVPSGLIRTLRACLNRDQTLRPTVDQLLAPTDHFLYPDAEIRGALPITQDILGRIIANVVNHCSKAGIPSETEISAWPAGFFGRIRTVLQEDGRI